jgi:hypothetical protein
MIRKIFYLVIVVGLVIGNPLMVSGADLTYTSTTITTVDVGGKTYTLNFKTSSGVSLSQTDGGATYPNSFNAASYHAKGDKTYGMDSDGGPVYFSAGTGATCPAATSVADFTWSTI